MSIFTRITLVACAAIFGSVAVAQAQPSGGESGTHERISVVELFTSQGCSSCPPADALLKRFLDRRDVLALTLPVDYWDYLGWKDTLANPKFSARQRSYAKTHKDGAVYTPQAVINGSIHVNGASLARIEEAIERTTRLPLKPVTLSCRLEQDAVIVEVGDGPAAAPAKSGTLWLAVVQPRAEVVIRHGENRGKTLAYYNVVRELTPVGMWSGKPLTVRLPQQAIAPGADHRLAVLLQQETTGPMLAAAWVARRN